MGDDVRIYLRWCELIRPVRALTGAGGSYFLPPQVWHFQRYQWYHLMHHVHHFMETPKPKKIATCCSMLQSDRKVCQTCPENSIPRVSMLSLAPDSPGPFLAIPGRHKCYSPPSRRHECIAVHCCVLTGEWSWWFMMIHDDSWWSWRMEILDIMSRHCTDRCRGPLSALADQAPRPDGTRIYNSCNSRSIWYDMVWYGHTVNITAWKRHFHGSWLGFWYFYVFFFTYFHIFSCICGRVRW